MTTSPSEFSGPHAFEYRFHVELRETARVNAAVMRNRRRTVWERLLMWGAGPIIVLAFGISALELARGRGSAGNVLIWVTIGGVLAFFRWGGPWLQARVLQKRLGGPGTEVSLSVHDAGVTSSAPIGSSTVTWAGIERVVDARRALLFYLTHNIALYLPRRVVALDSEWQALVTFVQARMRGRGGLTMEPSRRYQAPVAAGLAALALVLFVGLLLYLPPTRVVTGEELRPWHRHVLERAGLLRPDEEVYLFYTDAGWSLLEDVNLLTSNGLVSYAQEPSGVYRQVVPYDRIARVELLRDSSPSTIEVITTAGEEVILFASPRDDGDYAFVNRLKSEWRARVPGAGDGGGEP